MFFKKRNKQADIPQGSVSHSINTNGKDTSVIDESMSLRLHAVGAEAVYQFPPDLVHSLRHMITRLGRDGKLAKKLSIVAAQRQEGVSLTAFALASIMAHDLSQTVCLVDLNWWWPGSMMQHLAGSSPGLAPLLRGEADWEAALVHTSLPNLALLPTGDITPDKRPIVARSSALKECIEQLSSQVDYLLFDIPAILTTSDAIPLISLSDASCMIVQQGVSNRTAVAQAVREVGHQEILGVVLNRVNNATPKPILKWIPEE